MRAAALAAAALAAIALPSPAQEIGEEQRLLVDIDEDGTITLDEFRVAMSVAFVELDPDADNHLEAADLEGLADAAGIAAMDTDGDGKVSRMEFDAQTLADFRAADLDGGGTLGPID